MCFRESFSGKFQSNEKIRLGFCKSYTTNAFRTLKNGKKQKNPQRSITRVRVEASITREKAYMYIYIHSHVYILYRFIYIFRYTFFSGHGVHTHVPSRQSSPEGRINDTLSLHTLTWKTGAIITMTNVYQSLAPRPVRCTSIIITRAIYIQ